LSGAHVDGDRGLVDLGAGLVDLGAGLVDGDRGSAAEGAAP
jgi:hypothetical protein